MFLSKTFGTLNQEHLTAKLHAYGFNRKSLKLVNDFASKILSIIPIEIKNSSSVKKFENRRSKWEPNDCYCKLCQDFLYRIGYVNLFDG